MTKVMTHSCINIFQDKINGVGKRVFNLTKKGTFRCTSCGTIKDNESTPLKKK